MVTGMSTTAPLRSVPSPCVAHPHAGLVHRDGQCRCFVGGPAPEHEPERVLTFAS